MPPSITRFRSSGWAAKDAGATVIHVDPKFSRTSARCDFHVPLRSGTDIAFLGGMIKYILDNELYHKDYVVEYTNAAFLVGDGYKFKDGLFSGFDPATKRYDQKKWAFAKERTASPSVMPRSRTRAPSSSSKSTTPATPSTRFPPSPACPRTTCKRSTRSSPPRANRTRPAP